jgi:putative glutamine amidotransferase
MRIGLSYHGGDSHYDAYAEALRRRAQVLGIPMEPVWLAGAGRPAILNALPAMDGLLLTGGPDVEPARYGAPEAAPLCACDPERDSLEWQMLEALQRQPRPILAVCRGAQILNVFHGGTLVPDLGARNGVHRKGGDGWGVHDIAIVPGTQLERIARASGGLVNTSHHQAVDWPAPGFRVSARSEDGVIEALEPDRADEQPFVLAVQWHPEAMAAGLPLAERVLDAFLGSFAEKH